MTYLVIALALFCWSTIVNCLTPILYRALKSQMHWKTVHTGNYIDGYMLCWSSIEVMQMTLFGDSRDRMTEEEFAQRCVFWFLFFVPLVVVSLTILLLARMASDWRNSHMERWQTIMMIVWRMALIISSPFWIPFYIHRRAREFGNSLTKRLNKNEGDNGVA